MTSAERDLRFGPSFERDVRLANGKSVHLRWIRPADAALLREGFARLSEESRRLRFFVPMRELPSSLVRYLTEVDGFDHAALVAVSPPDAGSAPERGFGVARFVRDKQDSTRAEFAIVVTDDMQGVGLGEALTKSLAAAALERGIETFTMSVLYSNMRVRSMLQRAGAHAHGSVGDNIEYGMPTAALAARGLRA
jgi:ribosomal protein S18 acetylase RimI-like enzyme